MHTRFPLDGTKTAKILPVCIQCVKYGSPVFLNCPWWAFLANAMAFCTCLHGFSILVTANDYMRFIMWAEMINLCIIKYMISSHIYSIQYERTCTHLWRPSICKYKVYESKEKNKIITTHLIHLCCLLEWWVATSVHRMAFKSTRFVIMPCRMGFKLVAFLELTHLSFSFQTSTMFGSKNALS